MILAQTLSTDGQMMADSLSMLEPGKPSIGLLDLLIKGGYMMIPLYILFVIAVFIFVERLITLRKAAKSPKHLMDQIKILVQGGQVEKANGDTEQKLRPNCRNGEEPTTDVGVYPFGAAYQQQEANSSCLGLWLPYRPYI